MKKLYRELRRAFPYAEVRLSNGGHIKLLLPNGRVVHTSATPSE